MLDIKTVKKFLIDRQAALTESKTKEREGVIHSLQALSNIWQRHRVRKVYLYGAFADLSFHDYSDIDIAIDAEIEYEQFLALFSEVNRHFKRVVDLRLLSELPFRKKVIKTGFLVYERKDTDT